MQTTIRTALLTALPGQLFNASTSVVESYTNNTPQADLLVVTTGTSPVTFTINSTAITTNAGSAASTIAVAVGSAATTLNAASAPVVVLTAQITSNTMTIYSTVAGTAFTIAASTGCTTTPIFTNDSSIPFGRLVVQSHESCDGAYLPHFSGMVTAFVTLGITVRDNIFDDTADAGYTARSTMNILRRGYVWVTAEISASASSQVFARHTPGTTSSNYGALGGGADSATCSVVRGARWKEAVAAGSIGLLEVNFPAV